MQKLLAYVIGTALFLAAFAMLIAFVQFSSWVMRAYDPLG